MKKCKHCKSDIDIEAKICPNCRKRQSKKKIFIIIALIFTLIAIFVTLIILKKESREKLETNANVSFYGKVDLYNYETISIGVTMEEVGNDINNYWSDSIWEDKYNGDIDVAIEQALLDNEDKIAYIKETKSIINTYYNDVMNSKCYSTYCDDILEAVKSSYNNYLDFYSLIVSPSGNYTTFSDNFSDIDSNAINHYDEINSLLELFKIQENIDY